MSSGHNQQWATLGVVAPALSSHRHPMAVMINYNKGTKQFSFQCGLLKSGRVHNLRFWTENMLMEVAMLTRHLGTESLLQQFGVKEISSETLKKSVDESPFLRWVEEYIPVRDKKKVSMTLWDRARRT